MVLIMNRTLICICLVLHLMCGCSGGSTTLSTDERFVSAMVDASRELTDVDIYDGLISLAFGESSLTEWQIIDSDTLVLVSSLQVVDWEYSNIEVGDSFVTSTSPDYMLWVAIPREVEDRLIGEVEYTDSLTLNSRFLELLGLRPDNKDCVVNLMWVNKNDLLRPSYNPDPTTTCGAIEYPEEMEIEWYEDWLEGNIAYSYESPQEGLNYPFTRLGYTYDWGEGRSKYGVSEFVVAPSSVIIMHDRLGCWSYYQNLK